MDETSSLPKMLPGRTAEQWSKPIFKLSHITLGFTAITAVLYFAMGLTASTIPIWFWVLAVCTVGSFLAGLFSASALLWKASREAKAGYTTTGGGYFDLPQLDSVTGEVLRRPGDPPYRG